jgi:hypothetical protein
MHLYFDTFFLPNNFYVISYTYIHTQVRKQQRLWVFENGVPTRITPCKREKVTELHSEKLHISFSSSSVITITVKENLRLRKFKTTYCCHVKNTRPRKHNITTEEYTAS